MMLSFSPLAVEQLGVGRERGLWRGGVRGQLRGTGGLKNCGEGWFKFRPFFNKLIFWW